MDCSQLKFRSLDRRRSNEGRCYDSHGNQSTKSSDLRIIAALVALLLIGVAYAVTAGSGIGPGELATLIAIPP
jgi:hypothetical protein